MPNRDDRSKWVATDRHGPRRRNLSALMAIGLLFAAMPPFLEIFTDNENPDGYVSEVSAMTLLLILSAIQSPFAQAVWMGDLRATFPREDRDALAEASRLAALITLALAAAIFVWLWLASIFGWPAPARPKHWFALGFSFLTIGAALPIFLAERMVPIPPDEEGDA